MTIAGTSRSAASLDVVIIEDERAVREGLAELINATSDLRCPASYRSMEEALVGIGVHRPAVILTDLRQNLYVHESSSWAEMINRRIRSANPGPNRGVKQAGFVVLDGAFMPAVLVVLAFISNSREERLLADRAAQQDFASQLALAVHDFFQHHDILTAATNP